MVSSLVALGDEQDRCRPPSLGNSAFLLPWPLLFQFIQVEAALAKARYTACYYLSSLQISLLSPWGLLLRLFPSPGVKASTPQRNPGLSAPSHWLARLHMGDRALSPTDTHTGMKCYQRAPCSIPKGKTGKSPEASYICT